MPHISCCQSLTYAGPLPLSPVTASMRSSSTSVQKPTLAISCSSNLPSSTWRKEGRQHVYKCEIKAPGSFQPLCAALTLRYNWNFIQIGGSAKEQMHPIFPFIHSDSIWLSSARRHFPFYLLHLCMCPSGVHGGSLFHHHWSISHAPHHFRRWTVLEQLLWIYSREEKVNVREECRCHRMDHLYTLGSMPKQLNSIWDTEGEKKQEASPRRRQERLAELVLEKKNDYANHNRVRTILWRLAW